MRLVLTAMVGFALLCSGTPSYAGKADRPNGGYCPAGTCNMKGEDGGMVFDMKTCSKKYCPGSSKKK